MTNKKEANATYRVEYLGLLGNCTEFGWFGAFETTSEYKAKRRAQAIAREGRQVRVVSTAKAAGACNE